MGQKIRPDSYRLGIIEPWSARWFAKKQFGHRLEEDELIRNVIQERIKSAGIVKIIIERVDAGFRISIRAARPGLIIGRGGKGVEQLTKTVETQLKKLLRGRGISRPAVALNISIEELRRSEISAVNVAQNVAGDLERRLPFRRMMKKYLESIMQNREIKGAKIRLSGRLDGAEIARREWLAQGKLPLSTLRARIDYGEATAFTTYGTVGVKVWINKGETFEKTQQHVNS